MLSGCMGKAFVQMLNCNAARCRRKPDLRALLLLFCTCSEQTRVSI